MTDTMLWRNGETNPILMPVYSATVIGISDLVWLDMGGVLPASDVICQLIEATNQEYFHDRFAGVAMQRSASGDTDSIRVATSGVFEFNCASATFEVGDLVGVGAGDNAGKLQNQKVVAVGSGNENLAIGRCMKRVAPGGIRVLVDVVSTLMKGGPQAMA